MTSDIKVLELSLVVHAGSLPGFPEVLLFVDLSGTSVPLFRREAGGRALVVVPGADHVPVAHRRSLGGDAIVRIAAATVSLSWPEPLVYDQWDTSDSHLSLRLQLTTHGSQGSNEGRLLVRVMAGSYEGEEAPSLRALLRTLIGELELPSWLQDALRAS
jgi:hypothetical protein